jgi:sporulation protein YlmC with PRC-barrel domain
MTNKDPDVRETHDLIASDLVLGTSVYDSQGNHIGQIEKLILEKRGGRVSYAVLSFGGFLGVGDDHYPLPWEKLDYDESLAGFRIDITKEQVEGAPRYTPDQLFDWEAENGRRVYDYYGVRPYWI